MLRVTDYTLVEAVLGDDHTRIHRGTRDDGRPILARVLVDEYPKPADIARLRHEFAIERELQLAGVLEPLALEDLGHGVALIWADPEQGEATCLSELLRDGPLPIATALRIAASLAETLAAVHDHKIIHKNLNPAEVFVHPPSGRVWLAGFGIAARLSRESPLLASPRTLEGKLAYVSPEQTGRMNRSVDRRSDLYSLGAVLYELLTGSVPFTGDDEMELLYAHLTRQPTPPRALRAELPEPVSALVMILLEKNAERRYQHALALAKDLRACLAQLDASGTVTEFVLARAEHDPSAQIDIPQQLYGRELELQTLMAAWAAVDAGATEVVLVRGYSGIGKSALVHEIHRELTGARGYFVSGKFDQLGRAIPYAPVAAALRELVHLLLTEPHDELARVRARLLDGVGDSGGVLTQLVPELEHVIGPQPPLRELGASASRNRFVRMLQLLLRAVSHDGRPLVMFLDDLQWADLATLELLETLLERDATARLLLIGAYRTNEVDDTHPLVHTLRQIGAVLEPKIIELGPLGRGDVLRFVADALGSTIERVTPLARIIQAKTEGNPFFLIRLLVALWQDGSLRYDEATRAYVWDEARVEATAAADNVVHFMIQRIERLAAPTRCALQLAACIGHRFDLGTLATVASSSTRALADELWPALDDGMLVPLDGGYRAMTGPANDELLAALRLRFLHDRVQQAAYAGIELAQRAELHLSIGRLLLARGELATRTGAAFESVSHLNLGRALITDADERRTLARLNLDAGEAARRATALAAARAYFDAGISLLDASSFTDHHELAFALHRGVGEVGLATGDHEAAAAAIETLLEHGHTALERAEILGLRVVLCAALSDSPAAVSAGVEALALLGFEIPTTDEARREAYAAELAHIAAHMSARSIDELLVLAPMTAADKQLAMKLARHTALAAFGNATSLGYWLTAVAARLSLDHGSSDQSASAYALLGAVVASSTTRYAEAHALVKLALAVHEQRGSDVHEACMLGFYFVTVSHFAMHWRALLPYIERARVAGQESGDRLFHSYACSHRSVARLILGDPLDEVRADATRIQALMVEHELASAAATQTVVVRAASYLQGRVGAPSPASLSDDEFDEAAFVRTMEQSRMSFALYCYRTIKAMLLYLAGAHADALVLLEQVETMIPIAFTPEATFFTALVLLAVEPDPAREPERAAWLTKCRDKLELWARACPANYEHRRLLVEAELARRRGAAEQAMELYDQSIAAAREHDWPRDQALAEERAARFYLDRKRVRTARAYLTDAAYGHARWGALGHLQQLTAEFPGLVPIDVHELSAVVRSESVAGTDDIDVLAFARSLQTIAREVTLDSVVERLMQLVLRSAGAQRGALLLARGDELEVFATAAGNPPALELGSQTLLAQHEALPAAIIRYVARVLEPVVLDDATQSERFAGDPYVVRARPRSIACLPMAYQGRARAVLYLENSASTAAFTPARVELLGLLSSQALISIDNAELYARIQAVTDELAQANTTLEAEVQAQTTRLRTTNERLTLELAERQRAEADRARIQAERLAELSTPMIPLTRKILIMPLIGTLDRQRASELPSVAMTGTHELGARVVLVDVTGVKRADAGIADVLLATSKAVAMLGATVIVTGIGPRLALELSADEDALSSLMTRSTLEAGVLAALELIERERRAG